MKTAELTGVLLDYWVARALNLGPKITDQGCILGLVNGKTIDRPADGLQIIILDQRTMQRLGWRFSPSTDWSQGGPTIDREYIELEVLSLEKWRAQIDLGVTTSSTRVVSASGPTPLIAAMRAYVASKFGEEVPDETA